MMNFAIRYEAGEHEQVWAELLAAGAAVRGELRPDALDVVGRTMSRVRRNLERIVETLASNGFRFGFYPDGEEIPGYLGPLLAPGQDVDARVQELESLIGGPVPLSIYGFWKWVGSVSLVGCADGWPDGSDPLWVEPPDVSIDGFPQWEWQRERFGVTKPFGLTLAPDVYHKDNISGGPPYEMPVPNAAIDGVLRNLPGEYSFLTYLREALAWCGFPGFRNRRTALPDWLAAIGSQLERF